MVKAAVERNLPPKPRDKYSTAEVSQLVKDAIEMIRRSGIEYLEARYTINSAPVAVTAAALIIMFLSLVVSRLLLLLFVSCYQSCCCGCSCCCNRLVFNVAAVVALAAINSVVFNVAAAVVFAACLDLLSF